MLKFLRGRKKARNALLLIFVGLLTLSLIGLFGVVVSGGGAGLFRGAGGSDTVIARVGSYEVTVQELKDALKNFGQQIAQGQARNRQDDLSTLYDLYGRQVLDSLIRQKVILYETDLMKLGATTSEVQSRLKQIFSPWPGPEQYRARLQQAGITPVRFEDDLRASIAQEHLRSYVTAVVSVDPKAVEEDYRHTNTTYSVRWVALDPDKFKDKVQVTDADLRAHFDSHKDDFKVTAEQRRARYIFVDQNKAGQAIQIADDELKQDFTADRFVKQVRVSQIILNVPKQKKDEAKDKAAPAKPDEEEAIRQKAQGVQQRAAGAEGKPAEDFAKLAREFSEDAKTKSKGGDLGFISKNDKRESDDPLNRVFNMQKDEVTQPIKKGDSYYIIKVTDRKIPTFADARDDLLKEARSRKGYSKAVEIAAEAEQKFKETRNAEPAAAEVNKKHGAQVAVVKETPFFVEGDALPELGSASEFESSVFQLANLSDVADRMNVNNGFAIAQYLEKRDPHDPAFEEVREKVEKAYRADKARELAAQRAREIAKAQTVDELKKIAESMNLKADERVGLGAGDSIGPLSSDANKAPVYKLNVGDVTKEPIKTDSDVWVVAGLMGRKDPDMADAFQKERKSIEQRLLDERRNTLFSTYLAMTQKQLKAEGKIKTYDDAIAAGIEAGGAIPATGSPSGNPRMPTSGPGRPKRTPQGAQGFPRTVPGAR